MPDYPDITEYPTIVYLSIEELNKEIQDLLDCGIKNLIELQYIVEEVIRTVAINSNYHDNILDLLDIYASNIVTAKDRISFDIYREFIVGLANLVAYKLKQLRLYAIDDTAYYTVYQCHSLTLFSLLKVNPKEFMSILDEGYSIFGFPQ